MLRSSLFALFALSLGLTGCKFVETAELAARAQAAAKPAPGSDVAARWDGEILPYFSGKARPFAEVRAAVSSNLDEAGKTFGYREVPEGAPWNFPVILSGTITAANTKSRAGGHGRRRKA